MKVKMLLVAAALLAIASLGMAQTYPVYIAWFSDAFQLTQNCDGTGGAIPEGTTIWIHQDRDGDGAELTDPLAELCADPPSCPTGPPGTMNDQTMTMNGVLYSMGEGYFYTDYAVSQLAEPNYKRFFIVVHYCDTTVLPNLDTLIHCVDWMSGVQVTSSGQTYDVDCNESSYWTCTETNVTHPYVSQCTPDLFTYFTPVLPPGPIHYPTNFTDCIKVCAGQLHTVCVGPLAAYNRLPNGFVFPGCEPMPHPELVNPMLHCDSLCPPAMGWTTGLILNWVPITMPGPIPPAGLYYCAQILPLQGSTNGCLCVIVDFILPVEMGNVAIEPMNNALKVKWNTLSETDLSGFAIYRDNVRRGFVEAKGASDYEWVESDLENGHVYEYELRTVDLNEIEQVVATVSDAPKAPAIEINEYALYQNYPNPFNPSTTIKYDVLNEGSVTLTVYNATGQLVTTLVNGVNHANGPYSVRFDASNLTSGLYFYTVKIGNEFTATKKMLLVK